MPLSDWDKEMLALLDGRATHLPNARKAQNKTQISARAVDAYKAAKAAGGIDDGLPPSQPTGGAVEARERSLVITWDPPTATQGVRHTTVTIERPVDTVIRTKNVAGTTVTIASLAANQSHRVKLRHVDLWGRESDPVTVGDFTPVPYLVTGTDDQVGPGRLINGTVTATLGFNTSGVINAGGTQITSTGMTLQDASKLEGSFPGNAGDWITPKAGANVPSPFAGLGFFNDSPSSSRGIVMRASGASGGPNVGRIIMSADNGDQDTAAITTARIRLLSTESGRASVDVTGDMSVSGVISGDVTSNTSTITQGTAWSTVAGAPIRAHRIGNMVMLEGQVQNTSGSANDHNHNITNATGLPEAYAPDHFKYFVVPAQSGGEWGQNRRIVVEGTSGVIRLTQVGAGANEIATAQRLSLDGVCFTI